MPKQSTAKRTAGSQDRHGYTATGAQLGAVMVLEYRMEQLARMMESAGRELWSIHHQLHDIREAIKDTKPDV